MVFSAASGVVRGIGISSYSGRSLPISDRERNTAYSIRNREYTRGETPGSRRVEVRDWTVLRLELQVFYRSPAYRPHHPPLNSFRCVVPRAVRQWFSADFTGLRTSTFGTAPAGVLGRAFKALPAHSLLRMISSTKRIAVFTN